MAKNVNWYMLGWKYQLAANKRGKMKRILVYTGEYYSFNLPARRLRLFKAAYLILTLALYAAYILYNANNGSSGGEAFYSGAPAMLAIIPFIYLGMGVFSLLFAGENMTYRAYYASMKRIKYSTRIALVLLSISALGQIVFIALNGSGGGLEFRRLFGSVFCAADIGAMLYLQHRFPVNIVNTAEK